MNWKAPIFTLTLFGLVLVSCKKDDNEGPSELDVTLEEVLKDASGGIGKGYYVLPNSDAYSVIPQDPNNPLTKSKVELGKLLYHETGLAVSPMQPIGEGTFSCASCHFAQAGFQAGRHQGLGDGGVGFGLAGEGREPNPMYATNELDVQPIRTPTAMNGAYQSVLLWNGQFGATGKNVGTQASWTPGTPKENNFLGFEGLETQAIAGLDVHRMGTGVADDAELITTTQYRSMFDKAFPDVPATERYNRVTAGLAIGAFERTLLANEAPFQKWLRGDYEAMNDQEKRGAMLFFDKANCVSCHNNPALSKMEFYAVGMKDLNECPEPVFNTPPTAAEHLGRGGFTGNPNDNYKFKSPQLYNLMDSPFYGHGASMRSLREVVEYFNEGIAENPAVPASQLDPEFKPLGLTSDEVDDLVAFLETGLYDPNLMRYVPERILSDNCFPNNDPASRDDLGCN
jgi:cytochrome c peroxidase